MKKLLMLTTCCALLAGVANARNIAVPPNDPAALITVPDAWKFEEFNSGYSAVSPDKDIFFSVEYTTKNKVETLLKNNQKWMKENDIDGSVKPTETVMALGGLDGIVYRFDTKDPNGPTRVDFVLLPGGKNRVILLTLWASDKEREKHSSEIDSIMNSVKAIQ
ncbi:MAG: hypothetical protein JWN71_3979 [Xanthobacteraceae bacterium]|jgi:hypothetical protein|nr:hypothetical protein [Xanthobacteraceae bacterium]